MNFRMCNNYLPVEKGRWYKQDLINRNLNEIGDVFHDLFKCHFFTTIERLLYPNEYAEILMFIIIISIWKKITLFSQPEYVCACVCVRVCLFVYSLCKPYCITTFVYHTA